MFTQSMKQVPGDQGMSFAIPKSNITPMTRQEGQSRRKLSITIGVILALMVSLFYAVTLVRLQGNMAERASTKKAALELQKPVPVAKTETLINRRVN